MPYEIIDWLESRGYIFKLDDTLPVRNWEGDILRQERERIFGLTFPAGEERKRDQLLRKAEMSLGGFLNSDYLQSLKDQARELRENIIDDSTAGAFAESEHKLDVLRRTEAQEFISKAFDDIPLGKMREAAERFEEAEKERVPSVYRESLRLATEGLGAVPDQKGMDTIRRAVPVRIKSEVLGYRKDLRWLNDFDELSGLSPEERPQRFTKRGLRNSGFTEEEITNIKRGVLSEEMFGTAERKEANLKEKIPFEDIPSVERKFVEEDTEAWKIVSIKEHISERTKGRF